MQGWSACGSGYAIVASAGLVLGACADAAGVISSFVGLDVGAVVGAKYLHDLGYRGDRAFVANVEGGHIWNGHQSLSHVTRFFNAAPGFEQELTGQTDVHATWVGHVLAGRHFGAGDPVRNEGIAPGAELWSGSIAGRWPNAPFNGFFQYTSDSLNTAYAGPLLVGAGGRTADVVNSSWGSSSDFSTGFDTPGIFTDSIINQTGKVFVTSAGNGGPAANSVVSPGSAWNNITVGALGDDFSPIPYGSVAPFSSQGPSTFRHATIQGQLVFSIRATVDLAAPGTLLTAAFYGGATGSNLAGVASGGSESFTTFLQGTSFAAPIVAGGATLLVDVAYDRFAADAESRDGRVIKAVLQNSAWKIAGWNNGQQTVSGVIRTTQSLDWASGAGMMNLVGAYAQFTTGTTNVPGLGGGEVEPVGWDFGEVTQNAPNDYFINEALTAGAWMTVSLNWFADGNSDAYTGNLNSLDNLNLQVFEDIADGPDVLVAQSISTYNNVEHLHFPLPRTGSYYIRVVWQSELFDRFGDPNSEVYGLAWSVPAPGVLGLAGVSGFVAVRRRR